MEMESESTTNHEPLTPEEEADFVSRVEPASPAVISLQVVLYASADLIFELYDGGQPKCRETNLTRRSLLKKL
jgi:hypothetical protein